MSASIRVRDLAPSFVLEQPDPADIPLTILRLSFRAVKGNINPGAIRILGESQALLGEALTLCNIGRRALIPSPLAAWPSVRF